MTEYKEEHVMRVQITARTPELLAALADRVPIDFGCRGVVSQRKDGSVVADAYVKENRIKDLEQDGIAVKTIADQTAISRERQKQVGRGNRFSGELSIPRGLGKKIREE